MIGKWTPRKNNPPIPPKMPYLLTFPTLKTGQPVHKMPFHHTFIYKPSIS